MQIESSAHAMLGKEIAEKNRELRHLRGEELQGLNLEELKHLEKLLEAGLSRVTETKVFEVPSPPTHPSSSLTKFYFRPQFVDDERFLKEISNLKRKGAELMEENQQLKQQIGNSSMDQAIVPQQGQPSESAARVWISADPPQGYNNSDISLRLGLPFPN
ncbi:Transcription factor [Theobroma cacao]|nr:Transcription factor [Theobroma cacao]